MKKIPLRLGLQPNIALSFASCCISLSIVPLCNITLMVVTIYGTPWCRKEPCECNMAVIVGYKKYNKVIDFRIKEVKKLLNQP